MMNKAFLEDFKKSTGHSDVGDIDSSDVVTATMVRDSLQLYIAEKLWSIDEQMKHKGGR